MFICSFMFHRVIDNTDGSAIYFPDSHKSLSGFVEHN